MFFDARIVVYISVKYNHESSQEGTIVVKTLYQSKRYDVKTLLSKLLCKFSQKGWKRAPTLSSAINLIIVLF